MNRKAVLSQTEVSQILAAARTQAQNNQWAVTIVVVDDGGHPLALERLDGCAPGSAYIARYALGRDYHKVLRARLQALCDRIAATVGDFGYRVFTDSAPVLEVALAAKALSTARATSCCNPPAPSSPPTSSMRAAASPI